MRKSALLAVSAGAAAALTWPVAAAAARTRQARGRQRQDRRHGDRHRVQGRADRGHLRPGDVHVSNKGAKVTEFYVYAGGDRIMGEVENVAPA